jgi:uroporphyrinogen-III synthase
MSSLTGKRILVTRPRAQAADLCDKLSGLGAQPILFPTIEIAPLDDYSALDRAIASLKNYHWIVFTSVNGVKAFWERLNLSGLQDLTGLRFAAIGPATARALQQNGARAELIPDEYVAEAILEKIGDVKDKWILLPRADIAREVLAVELSNRGGIVHEIAAYRTLPAIPDARGLTELQRGVDAITFTSSSTVRNFVALVDQSSINDLQSTIACIGPITAQTAREVGLSVDVIAREYTMDGLVVALLDYFSQPEIHMKEKYDDTTPY